MTQSTALSLRANTGAALMPLSGSLESYIQSVSRIPVLDAEEESRLAHRLHDEQDLPSAQKLVFSNLRFVVHIARGYMGYGLQLADLIQEGNVGLMKAVKRFDPNVGVRLISFAVHWIKAEIHEFILKNWRIVKIATTKAQRKLFFNLRSAKQRLGWMNQSEVEAIAKDLKVKPEEVMQMESRLGGHDVSFSMTTEDSEETSYVPEDYLATEDSTYAEIEDAGWNERRETTMRNALAKLDDRAKSILMRRWLSEDGQKAGLQELADEYGVSAERIRQIEAAAMKKLRKAIEALPA
ncbi:MULTISPECIES: RNA polymerase sigma factor RpoH [Hydrocarboniphaga]|uniref:RNA polymerase sigma factor RpoH n=1 Tax=Hydrocarboniphaga effusa AP103 TaxID=1172194 RepID=I8TBL7_9GAMM|nr:MULTISPECIES: RNA polymerase sigma factor RpoH [Hydrocarboniphaga]EIT71260.1 RNA polymerase factor sigma-32 [Hydrocarboniphaga effusa AP103]MDZ4077774.1 RNA polymerase sigma factor RpoH [Hydrocarboniphaga sp.]